MNATHIDEFADRFDPGAAKVDQAGYFTDEASGGNGALPEWKASVGVEWHRREWQFRYNLYLVSDLAEVVPLIFPL